jgi:hypothetical protein
MVSNPGIYAQDCYVGIFIPLKMGKIRPLLTLTLQANLQQEIMELAVIFMLMLEE